MVKKYATLKVEQETYKRFKRVKNLLEFQDNDEYPISMFIDILLDEIGKKLVPYIDKTEKPKPQGHVS